MSLASQNPDPHPGPESDDGAEWDLWAVVQVDPSNRVRCQCPGCTRAVWKAIHVVVWTDGRVETWGSTCFARDLKGQHRARPFDNEDPWRNATSTGGRRLSDDERAMLETNRDALIAHIRAEHEAMAAAAEARRAAELAREAERARREALRESSLAELARRRQEALDRQRDSAAQEPGAPFDPPSPPQALTTPGRPAAPNATKAPGPPSDFELLKAEVENLEDRLARVRREEANRRDSRLRSFGALTAARSDRTHAASGRPPSPEPIDDPDYVTIRAELEAQWRANGIDPDSAHGRATLIENARAEYARRRRRH